MSAHTLHGIYELNIRDWLELVTLGAIWGASFLFMRIAAPEFGPLALILVRVAVAALLLTIVLAVRGKLSTLRGHARQFLIMGAMNSAVPFSLFAFATLSLPAGFSGVLNATVPLFATLITYLYFREHLATGCIVGVFVGFCGVVILVAGKLTLSFDVFAVGAGLLAAFLYAASAFYGRRNLRTISPLVVSTGSLIAASCMLMPCMALSLPARPPSFLAWMSALALGVFCTGVAYVYYFRLLARIGPGRTVTVTYLIPAFAILWGCLLLGESITSTTLIGAAVVLIGTTLIYRYQ